MKIKDINKIDLSKLATKIKDSEAKGFFILDAGKEHYKLLAYLSMQFKGIEISDIGTYKGCSALALSYNKENKIISYDISNMVEVVDAPKNIEFRIIKNGYSEDILKSELIVLDTIHDGVHERLVIDFLIKSNWKGILILDDIHHFPKQKELWNDITLRKEDITSIGHWSGTGIVYFE